MLKTALLFHNNMVDAGFSLRLDGDKLMVSPVVHQFEF